MCKMIDKKDNIFGDNIALAERWDFTQANLSDETRIMAITTVASICYQSPKSIGSESLYNRLMAESQGLPSSSFEFVPVLIPYQEFIDNAWGIKFNTCIEQENGEKIAGFTLNMEKFGCWIEDGRYLLTNFRAVVYDFENNNIDFRNRYNTLEECLIIAKHVTTFRFKVDLPTRSQMVRHRANIQELSRRYVSGKRIKVDHYVSEKMKKVKSTYTFTKPLLEAPVNSNDDLTGFAGATSGYITENIEISVGTQEVIDICMNHYFKALEDGVKPQEARRIIPQTAYSEIWFNFLPYQLENYLKLRDDSHAQWEIRQTAIAMKDMLGLPLTIDKVG